MRIVIALLGVIALLAVSKTASADTSSWAPPVVSIQLLDGLRASPGVVDLRTKRGANEQATQASDKDRTADPGEELTAYVERMWSQVRAYRRPGGAEFILRGKF